MRTFLKVAAAALAIGTFSAKAASPSNVLLDFESNTVPPGWTVYETDNGHNCGVADGRYYAGATDSRCVMYKGYAAAKKTKNVTVTWTGNIQQSYWGSSAAVQLIDENGKYFMARFVTSTFNTADGVRLEVAAGQASRIETVYIPFGVYDFTATYKKGGVLFSGSSAGVQQFSVSLSGDPLVFSNIRALELFVYQTVSDDTWMDNIRIQQFSCANPTAGGCP